MVDKQGGYHVTLMRLAAFFLLELALSAIGCLVLPGPKSPVCAKETGERKCYIIWYKLRPQSENGLPPKVTVFFSVR